MLEPLLMQEVRQRVETALRVPAFGDPFGGSVEYHVHDYGMVAWVAGRAVRVNFELLGVDE